MTEFELKSIYFSLLDSNKLLKFFPRLTGWYYQDREEFIQLIKEKWPNYSEYSED